VRGSSWGLATSKSIGLARFAAMAARRDGAFSPRLTFNNEIAYRSGKEAPLLGSSNKETTNSPSLGSMIPTRKLAHRSHRQEWLSKPQLSMCGKVAPMNFEQRSHFGQITSIAVPRV
jgi:hypothetical protein